MQSESKPNAEVDAKTQPQPLSPELTAALLWLLLDDAQNVAAKVADAEEARRQVAFTASLRSLVGAPNVALVRQAQSLMPVLYATGRKALKDAKAEADAKASVRVIEGDELRKIVTEGADLVEKVVVTPGPSSDVD